MREANGMESVWKTQLEDYHDGFSITGATRYFDGLVFTGMSGAENGVRGRIYALDARTGAQLWRTSLAASVHGSPITYEAGGTQYVAVSAGNSLFAFALTAFFLFLATRHPAAEGSGQTWI